MIAGWPAYIAAWKTSPRAMAAQMTSGLPVFIMGKAKKPQVAPSRAPAAYTGLRPHRSDSRPNSGITRKCTTWAPARMRSVADVASLTVWVR